LVNKVQFVVQPYWTGSTKSKSKSLVFVIPSEIVKSNEISPSTAFILRPNGHGFNLLYIKEKGKNTIPVDNNSFAAKDQQVGIAKGEHWK
jgi:hypothetical protein